MNTPTAETKFLQTTTGPFSVEYIAHSDPHSFDLEAGEVGACVATADAALAWRETHPRFHTEFTPILEELSGEARKVDEKATKARRRAAQPQNRDKVKPVYESFIVFANRAKALVLQRDGGETLWSEIEDRALAFSRTLKIDAAPRVAEIPLLKVDLEKAREWLANTDPDFVEEKVAKFSDFVGGYDIERDEANKPKDESLAKLITCYMRKKRESELASD